MATSSGTAALHLAMIHLGIDAADEVVCPTLTFCASANPVVYQGARPVFVDCDESSWCIDPALLEQLLDERASVGKLPKAVVSVDLYGQCADYERLEAICARFELPLIADAAEALGASYRGKPAGSFGRCAVFSFNGNKIITTGGGGMLVSDDEQLVERARFLASQARENVPHYEHEFVGYNYRLSNILAAIGRGQLERLDDYIAIRRGHFEAYEAALGSFPGVQFMPEAPYGRCTRWLSCMLLDPEQAAATPEQLRLALEAENIEARPLWKPMHLQPVFRGHQIVGGAVSERLFARGLCLPSGSCLTRDQRQRVIDIVGAQLRGHRAR